jgi:hypothetical protein
MNETPRSWLAIQISDRSLGHTTSHYLDRSFQ